MAARVIQLAGMGLVESGRPADNVARTSFRNTLFTDHLALITEKPPPAAAAGCHNTKFHEDEGSS